MSLFGFGDRAKRLGDVSPVDAIAKYGIERAMAARASRKLAALSEDHQEVHYQMRAFVKDERSLAKRLQFSEDGSFTFWCETSGVARQMETRGVFMFPSYRMERLPQDYFRWVPKSDDDLALEELLEQSGGWLTRIVPLSGQRGRQELVPRDIATKGGQLAAFIHARFGPGSVLFGIAGAKDGGLVVEAGPASSRPRYYDAHIYTVSPGTVPSKKLAEINRFAFNDDDGRTVVAYDDLRSTVTVARLDHFTSAVRDRFAELMKCAPWELDLDVPYVFDEETQTGRMDSITVRSAPLLNIEQSKREAHWKLLMQNLPASPGMSWVNAENAKGQMVLRTYRDQTADARTVAEFQTTNRHDLDPWNSWKRYPVAWTDEGAEVNFSIFHTLIVGQSGAGKGSVIWSIIFGLLPAARAGLVEFYAIDPKAAEAPMAKGLFKEIATEEDAWLELLRTLVEDLKARQNTRLGKTRETTISKETPLRILLIDELAAVTLLDTDAKRKKEVESLLRIILTQGRSELTMVIAAVQNPQKETLGQLRQSFGMRIALRTADAGETDMVLGPGAVEKGALSHEIAVATKGNGNRTAGVAYMVEDDPENEGSAKPKKVRFPYTSDEDLREISDEFVRLKRDPSSIIAPDKRGRVVLPKPNQSVYDLADYLKGGMSPFDYLKTSTTQPLKPASTPAAPPNPLIPWDSK